MASRSTARSEAAAGRPPAISFAGWCRVWARIAALFVTVVPCVLLHYSWRALRQSSPWPRLFLGTAARIAGARVERIGRPVRRDVIYIANHVSWVDILVIAGASGSAFVAKDEIGTSPLVGWLSTLNRTIFVSREDRMGVAAQVERLREALADIWSVTIFPEGTTTDGRSLLPFRSSLLAILEPPPPGLVVQPMLLDYGLAGPDIGWIGVESGRNNALRVLARPGSYRVGIEFLEPFDPQDVRGRKGIAAESRRRIADALARVLGGPVPAFVGHDVWSAASSMADTDRSTSTTEPG